MAGTWVCTSALCGGAGPTMDAEEERCRNPLCRLTRDRAGITGKRTRRASARLAPTPSPVTQRKAARRPSSDDAQSAVQIGAPDCQAAYTLASIADPGYAKQAALWGQGGDDGLWSELTTRKLLQVAKPPLLVLHRIREDDGLAEADFMDQYGRAVLMVSFPRCWLSRYRDDPRVQEVIEDYVP